MQAEQNENVQVVDKGSTWDKNVRVIGLHKSSVESCCFIEGTDGVDQNNSPLYYYTIGLKTEWNKNLLPGYLRLSNIEFHKVNLWIKISKLQLLKNFLSLVSCKKSLQIFIFPIFFCFILI